MKLKRRLNCGNDVCFKTYPLGYNRFKGLHGVRSQKMESFMITAVRTSNPATKCII
jgi:hypothetical protein